MNLETSIAATAVPKWDTTVIIPAFNRRRFIVKAVESVLAQTVQPAAIIVVDDGSTDGTGEIARSLSERVTVRRIENNGAGPSRPRNVGIAAATSRHITLLDSDDVLAPTVIERHSEVFAAFPRVGITCNNFALVDHIDGKPGPVRDNVSSAVNSVPSERFGNDVLVIGSDVASLAYCRGNFIRTSGSTFLKAGWERVGGFDESLRIAEDYDFFLRLLADCDLAYVDQVLSLGVCHDGNISGAKLGSEFRPRDYLDTITVLDKALARARSADEVQVLRSEKQQVLLKLAYGYRQSQDYVASVRTYVRALNAGPAGRAAVAGLVRVPVVWVRDRLKEVR